ncbi:MAG TPA: CbrC family protein [Thermoanaerobaculia bacterium]|nr:CbrC family protein [Thermoanaerobaculia bacterium]
MSYTYRYFKQPHAFSTFGGEPKECGICEAVAPGYEGPFIGEGDLDFACESCLHSGRLAEDDFATNAGDGAALRVAIAAANPGLPAARVEALAGERTAELHHRTPQITTWQDLTWPVHCSDYCRYEKEAGRADLVAMAGPADPKRFFVNHLHPEYRGTDLDHLWQSIRADSPQDNSAAYDTTAYLFACVECGEAVILWDCS